jgi:hypothetical protein
VGDPEGEADGTAEGEGLGAEEDTVLGAMLGASEGIMDGASLGTILEVSLGAPVGASVGTNDGASLGSEDGALEEALDGKFDGKLNEDDSDGAALGAKVGAVDGERDCELDGDNVGALVGAQVGALLGLTVGDSESTLALERLRNWDLLLDLFFDSLLLLLLSLDSPLDFLDFPSSLDLSVLFFDAAVSEPFFLDLLLLPDFVEVDCFFSESFFLDLLLCDFGDFFFSEALDFAFLDSSSVLREPFFLASALLSEDPPFFFFETAALDLPLLDLDFFEDSLDWRLRDDDSSSGSSKKKKSECSWVGIKVVAGTWWEGIKAEAGIQVVGAKVGDKVTTSSKLLLLLLLTDLLDFLEDLLALVDLDLDLDSLDFLARRWWCDVASDDSTEAARRPWRTGRLLVVTVVDAEVKIVVAARRTARCFVEKYMMLLLFEKIRCDAMLSRGYRDEICELILFGRYSISSVGAIPWFSLEHGWNSVGTWFSTTWGPTGRRARSQHHFRMVRMDRMNVSTTHAMPTFLFQFLYFLSRVLPSLLCIGWIMVLQNQVVPW